MHRLDFDGSFLSIAIRTEQKNSKSFSTSFFVVVVAPVVVGFAVAEVVVVGVGGAAAVLRDVAQQVMQMIVSAKQLRRGLTEAKECRT